MNDFVREINLMCSLRPHSYDFYFLYEFFFKKLSKNKSNVIQFLGFSIDPKGNILLLLEYCKVGSLYQFLRNGIEQETWKSIYKNEREMIHSIVIGIGN